MPQLVRVEHKDGHGIFRHKILRPDLNELGLSELVDRHYNEIPTPREDIGRFIREYEFCAFKSIEQVKNHILPQEMKILLENDYRVYLIEVSECVEGSSQIIFEKEKIISKKNISHKFKVY